MINFLEAFYKDIQYISILKLSIITLLIFFLSYFYERRRLLTGFLFNIFLFVTLTTLVIIGLGSNNFTLELMGWGLLAVLLIIFLFGIYALIIVSLWNARIVMKREQKSVSNLLTLFLGLGLIVYLIINIIIIDRFLPPDIIMFLNGFYFIGIYCVFDVINFLMSLFIYQFNKPKLNQDFIIVLGSRLIGDKVPPLLASRIDKAIEFYNKQAIVSNPPKIIFSGGQGSDEKISEALGMQKYAIEKGIPEEDTIVEEKSISTFENMKFSKKIMEDLNPSSYNSIFVTNNYHLLRAGIYAKLAGLKSQGIGSKTAKYFLPNAIIREYIAILAMYKKRYIAIFLFILVLNFILIIIPKVI